MAENSYTKFVEDILTTISEDRIFTDTLRCLAYGTDGGFYRLQPQVVVRVFSEREMICCLKAAHRQKLPVTFKAALLAASDNGNYSILCDTSPCLYRMRKKMVKSLALYEPVEFVHSFLFDKLSFQKQTKVVAIHSTCSTQKLGLTKLLKQVAARCATEVLLPNDINCCGFAGDKGFTLPDLNNHGLRKAVSQVREAGAVAGYSNSRTCEIGCASYTGIPYMSIMYLVDEATKPLMAS